MSKSEEKLDKTHRKWVDKKEKSSKKQIKKEREGEKAEKERGR